MSSLKFFEIKIIMVDAPDGFEKNYYLEHMPIENMHSKFRAMLGIPRVDSGKQRRGRPPLSNEQPSLTHLRKLKYLSEYFVAIYDLVQRGVVLLPEVDERQGCAIPRTIKKKIYEDLRAEHGPLPSFQTFNNILSALPDDEVLYYQVKLVVGSRIQQLKRSSPVFG